MTSHQRHICAIVIYNHWASDKYHRPRLRLSKRGSSPFASPSRRPLRRRRPTRRRGERGLSPTSFRQDDVKQRTTSHDRESPTEAITRTRVVRARSSATWDSTAIPAPDSFPQGIVSTGSQARRTTLASRWGSPHTLEPPTWATPLDKRRVRGCSDRRMGSPRRPPTLNDSQTSLTRQPKPITTDNRAHSPTACHPGLTQQCPLKVRKQLESAT